MEVEESCGLITDLPPAISKKKLTFVHSACRSHAHAGLVEETQTVTDSKVHLKLTPVDPEPTQSGLDFKPHQSLSQLAAKAAHPKEDPGRNKTLLGAIPT